MKPSKKLICLSLSSLAVAVAKRLVAEVLGSDFTLTTPAISQTLNLKPLTLNPRT